MMMLTYQRKTLKARVSTWLGSLLLASVAGTAALIIWQAATGENAIVSAFSKGVEQRTSLEGL